MAGVSFSFDNIFLNEVENEFFCNVIYYPIDCSFFGFHFPLSTFRVDVPLFNNSGAKLIECPSDSVRLTTRAYHYVYYIILCIDNILLMACQNVDESS